MAKLDDIINTFEDFKALSEQERTYFVFQAIHQLKNGVENLIQSFSLDSLDRRYDAKYAIKEMEQEMVELKVECEKKYAGKWVENTLIAVCSAAGLTIVAAVLNLIINK